MSAVISVFCSLFLGFSSKNWHVYLSALLGVGVAGGHGACRSGIFYSHLTRIVTNFLGRIKGIALSFIRAILTDFHQFK
jgi:hypothetical protein